MNNIMGWRETVWNWLILANELANQDSVTLSHKNLKWVLLDGFSGNTATTDMGLVMVASQNNKTNTKDISANGGSQ